MTNELLEALFQHDDDKRCHFCAKTEWGAEKHEEGCPFEIAYRAAKPLKVSFFKDGEQSPVVFYLDSVQLSREHLRLSPDDWSRYGGELDNEDDYPPNTLASAQETGRWWLRTKDDWYDIIEVEARND